MDERTRKLNQSFVEGVIRTVTVREPEFLKHVVGFVKKALIEAFKIAEIMGGEVAATAVVNQRGDFGALFTHESKFKV